MPQVPTRACLQRVADWGSPAHVGEMRRLDVTDAQWQRLEPLLPPEKPRTGRPNHDHRRVVSGMLWIHRTGAPGATCRSAMARSERCRAASIAGAERVFGTASS